MIQLKQKTAFITGASRGIGRGIALKLAESGVKRIAINYIENDAAANDTVKKLKDRGAEGVLLKGDVCKSDDVKSMFAKVKAAFGSLDIFVHNARPSPAAFYQPPMQLTEAGLQAAFDSQAKMMLLACQSCATMMSAGGRIFGITYAPGGTTGSWQAWIAMGGAKAAMESIVRYFAVAMAKKGITVNCVSPGSTDDSVINGLGPGYDLIKKWNEAGGGGWTPQGRLGTPADIGNVISLLSAEEASWITGQTIFADGGQSLMCADWPPEVQAFKG